MAERIEVMLSEEEVERRGPRDLLVPLEGKTVDQG